MVIIIDGYNLLRAMFPKVKGRLTKQRDQLVKSLGIYKSKKDHDITIVFDAGPFRHAVREVHEGVAVVFAGQGRSADDYIVDYVKKHKEKEKLLVSNDRELINRCDRYNIDKISVYIARRKRVHGYPAGRDLL